METERILLRNFQTSDLMDLYEYCSQDGVGEAAGWRHHTSLSQSQKTLQDFMRNNDLFAIVHKADRKVIGHIGIYPDTEENRADTKELGFVLNRGYQKQGIMTEVVNEVLREFFSRGIQTIYACCFQENLPSKNLIEKCGFEFDREGTYYSSTLIKTFHSFEYVYTRERWKSQHPGH